jgi:hypothetical protein
MAEGPGCGPPAGGIYPPLRPEPFGGEFTGGAYPPRPAPVREAFADGGNPPPRPTLISGRFAGGEAPPKEGPLGGFWLRNLPSPREVGEKPVTG